MHEDLVAVVKEAIERTEVDFSVIDGVRTVEEQADLVRMGASWTQNSRHLTGHAVDLAAWVGKRIRWEETLYVRIGEAMKAAAQRLAVPLEWGALVRYGGDWRVVNDMGHFQLPWEAYPNGL